jgi:hypothetical protein
MSVKYRKDGHYHVEWKVDGTMWRWWVFLEHPTWVRVGTGEAATEKEALIAAEACKDESVTALESFDKVADSRTRKGI